MRRGADVTVAAYAPTGLDIYLGYVDGNYPSYNALVKRFPGKLIVPIAVFPSTNAGTVFDGPPDNSTWPRVVDWVVMRRAAGVDPTVYTDADQWPVGVAAFNARGVVPPHWWIAQWNGVQNVPSGAVGHQYASNSQFDSSVFLDYWPGVDPNDAVPAGGGSTAAPSGAGTGGVEDDEMIMFSVTKDPSTGEDPGIWLLSGAMYAGIPAIGDVQAMEAQGVKIAPISLDLHHNLVAASAKLSGKLTGSLAVSGNLQAQ